MRLVVAGTLILCACSAPDVRYQSSGGAGGSDASAGSGGLAGAAGSAGGAGNGGMAGDAGSSGSGGGGTGGTFALTYAFAHVLGLPGAQTPGGVFVHADGSVSLGAHDQGAGAQQLYLLGLGPTGKANGTVVQYQGSDLASIEAMTQAPLSSNLFVVGWFRGSPPIGAGGPALETDSLIAPLNPGSFSMAAQPRAISGSGSQRVTGIAIDDKGAYIVGSSDAAAYVLDGKSSTPPAATTGSCFVGRTFVGGGSPQDAWLTAINSGGIECAGMAHTGAQIVVTGTNQQALPVGFAAAPKAKQAFVLRLGFNGDLNSAIATTWGDDASTAGKAIVALPGGDVALAGQFGTSIALDKVLETKDATFDGFVARLNAQDKVLWSHHLPGTGNVVVYAMATDDDGVIYVVGAAQGSIDLGAGPIQPKAGSTPPNGFLVALSSTGETLQGMLFEGPGAVRATRVAARGKRVVVALEIEQSATVPGAPTVTASSGPDVAVVAFDH